MLTSIILLTVGIVNAAAPVVNLKYARFQGGTDAVLGIDYYYGMRYAAPPTGNLRWRGPQDIEETNYYKKGAVTNASAHAPSCYQAFPAWLGFEIGQAGQSEDCLIVDVVRPSNPKIKKLPVVVQIHGGGYTFGNSYSMPGEEITSFSDGEVIWCNIQYRLSAFGFLNSNEVQENGMANAGLLDQRAALNWVQKYISQFGGDPAKVTISGGSAGGGSVTNQMIMYGGVANPPFRAAIAEYPYWEPYHNETILERQYTDMLSLTGCSTLNCLRTLNSSSIASASTASFALGYNAGFYGYGDYYYGPSVDGVVIRDLPSNEFKQGHFTKVPLLVDHDAFEGIAFTNSSIVMASQGQPDLQQVFPYGGPSFFARLYELYPASAFSGDYFSDPLVQQIVKQNPKSAGDTTFFQTAQVFGNFIIDCPTYYMATAVSDAGMPVWKLNFAAGSLEHAATASFLFTANNASTNATISEYMKDWFISFAVDLNPNSISPSKLQKPHWPQYDSAISTSAGKVTQFTIMQVNETAVGTLPDPDASGRCDFLHSQSYVVRN